MRAAGVLAFAVAARAWAPARPAPRPRAVSLKVATEDPATVDVDAQAPKKSIEHGNNISREKEGMRPPRQRAIAGVAPVWAMSGMAGMMSAGPLRISVFTVKILCP